MWWLDWYVFEALCVLVLSILFMVWLALRPRREYLSGEIDPDFCELHEGKRPQIVTIGASYERDADGFLICTRCKNSIYACDICQDPECPTTLMMARLGIKETESELSSEETQKLLGAETPIPVSSVQEGADIFLRRHQNKS